MSSNREQSVIGSHLEEIHELEDRLITLKRQFLEKSSVFLGSFADENGTIPFLIAMSMGHHFAIPVSVVEEVIEMVAVTPVIEKRRGLLGVFNYHGKLTALFDLSDVANAGKNEISPDNVIVICIVGDRVVGLMATEATDVYMVEENNLRIAEEVFPGAVRALGIVQLSDNINASVIDIWSTMMGVKPEKWKSEPPPDGDDGIEGNA